MIEQIGVVPLREQLKMFGVIGGPVNPLAHIHRYYRIQLAMENEQRHFHGFDIDFIVKFIRKNDA
jgi:hypothetical protein